MTFACKHPTNISSNLKKSQTPSASWDCNSFLNIKKYYKKCYGKSEEKTKSYIYLSRFRYVLCLHLEGNKIKYSFTLFITHCFNGIFKFKLKMTHGYIFFSLFLSLFWIVKNHNAFSPLNFFILKQNRCFNCNVFIH